PPGTPCVPEPVPLQTIQPHDGDRFGSLIHAGLPNGFPSRTAKLLQRLFRWILPLKESNLTEDAAFPAVPTRERALSTGKVIWVLGNSGKSLSTCPLTERAVTSIEA